jgi:hypothetical protein
LEWCRAKAQNSGSEQAIHDFPPWTGARECSKHLWCRSRVEVRARLSAYSLPVWIAGRTI